MNTETEKLAIIPERFKQFMDIYFHGYEYEYEDTNSRGNHNYREQYGLININKAKLDQNEIENIYKKLEEGGWRLVETNHKNYANLCYGEKIFAYHFLSSKMGRKNALRYSIKLW